MKKTLYEKELYRIFEKEFNELNELDALMMLYSLSMTHPILTKCENQIVKGEIMIRIFYCFNLLINFLDKHEGGKENERNK